MMKSIEKTLDSIEKRCSNTKLRLTDKRKKVLAILIASKKGFSAYDMIDQYELEFGETLKAMSIYRILSYLQSEQLVHKISTTNKYVACIDECCQSKYTLPLFLICRECQDYKETSVEPAFLKSLQQNAMQAGFQFNNTQLEINCVCQSCQP